MAYKNVKKYGWKPDHPDHRDLQFTVARKTLKALPPKVDLRPQMPPVFNQGELGSCTANSACALIANGLTHEGQPLVIPSRLFQYYNTRLLENTVRTDSGGSIRDSIKALAQYGFCPEALWPYNIKDFAKKPSPKLYAIAKKDVIKQYHRVTQNEDQIKAALAQNLPVDFGFTVYESFESDSVAATGLVPMPVAHEKIMGGHAVLIVGYDDEKSLYTVRNSWGSGWGVDGYCYMPYAFINSPKYASDFWVVSVVG
jgi:C1A family cysteine protease